MTTTIRRTLRLIGDDNSLIEQRCFGSAETLLDNFKGLTNYGTLGKVIRGTAYESAQRVAANAASEEPYSMPRLDDIGLDGDLLVNGEPLTHEQIHAALRQYVDGLDTPQMMNSIRAVFDSHFIYRAMPAQGEVKFYRQSYTIKDSGVEIGSGNPVQVREITTFDPITNTNITNQENIMHNEEETVYEMPILELSEEKDPLTIVANYLQKKHGNQAGEILKKMSGIEAVRLYDALKKGQEPSYLGVSGSAHEEAYTMPELKWDK